MQNRVAQQSTGCAWGDYKGTIQGGTSMHGNIFLLYLTFGYVLLFSIYSLYSQVCNLFSRRPGVTAGSTESNNDFNLCFSQCKALGDHPKLGKNITSFISSNISGCFPV